MSQSSSESSRTLATGADFLLSDEVLSVIPTDPYEQLDLARKITSMAIASRVTKLESEVGRLREMLHHKDRAIVELEDKVSNLEQAYQETELRLKITREDNMKLLKEKNSLTLTAKKLGRDLEKLETFKRQLMQSLNDDNSTQSETVDIGTYDQSVAKPYHAKGSVVGILMGCHLECSTFQMKLLIATSHNIPIMGLKRAQGSLMMDLLIEPQVPLHPPNFNMKDGVQCHRFFHQASNLQRQTLLQGYALLCQDTLRKAEEIFGKDNKDLYLLFQGLLNRSAR
nr:uncharacterized protein At4g15545 [Ipomoea trifida]